LFVSSPELWHRRPGPYCWRASAQALWDGSEEFAGKLYGN
jgi:hypothetical protein